MLVEQGNQAAGFRIQAIEKCFNLYFVRSITRSRYDYLRDPLPHFDDKPDSE